MMLIQLQLVLKVTTINKMNLTRMKLVLVVVVVGVLESGGRKVNGSSRNRRVANATTAARPIEFMVSLENRPFWFWFPHEHVCGGSVISSFWVLRYGLATFWGF